MKKTNRIIISVILSSGVMFLSACSTAPQTNKQAGTLSKESVVTVQQGTVTALKEVTIQGSSTGAGGTVGSIAGSLLGSSVPVAGSIIGSLIGSAVGSGAEKQLTNQQGYEITVTLINGEKFIVTQLAETKFERNRHQKISSEKYYQIMSILISK